ncbi:MAG: MBL fold hydrolase [Euryarchaeota archaeon RBG_13_31_8]|nr:MAG: MBL fold hydrolase [Euryarchaeota archaeon RBG_13_31_8]
MKKYNIPQLTKDVFSVGVKDWNRRMFDALIPLPQGTTYNCYFIKGKEKTAQIDTVNPGFEGELIQKIDQISDVKNIDFLIMNHAEPDHAGSIPVIMSESKKAMLITTEKGAKMAQTFFDIQDNRIKIVKDGEKLDLGGKTLQFISAPWLHWPETMFTYLIEDKILFPCDFFGAHTATGIYDDDVDDLIFFAKRYYGEIMMPFNRMGNNAMEKIKDLKIEMIAPSHGPIYKNPKKIMDVYKKWTKGETEEKAIIIFVSMWKSTEKMINAITETLLSNNIKVSKFDLTNADIGDIARELVDSKAVVLGVPTVLGGMHPLGIYASYLVKALRPPLKYAVVLSSFGWGGGAIRQVSEILGPSGLEIVGTVDINGPPKDSDYQKILELGNQLVEKIKNKIL